MTIDKLQHMEYFFKKNKKSTEDDWISFKQKYKIKDDRYIEDIKLLKGLKNTVRYPIILYPKSLSEQISKKIVADGRCGSKDYIGIHDFLNVAKSLGIEGDDWQYLSPPYNPKSKLPPTMPQIPTEIRESYETLNWWGVTIFAILMLIAIGGLLASAIEDGAWCISVFPLTIILVWCVMGGDWFQTVSKTRYRKLTREEIEQLEKEARVKFIEEVEKYQKSIDEYDEKVSEYKKLLDTQSKLLDKNAKLIVSTLFKRCLINDVEIDNCISPPQRGALEDKLFYALMKEIPSYVKVDKSFGCYFPDLVIHNGYSCPIDIEIDEPYDYKTKKEIHYIGCNDEERNYYFESNNWFVIRFTENQIKNHLSECVDIVKAFVHFIEHGDTTKLYGIENTIKRIQEPRWTKEEARMMAIDNYRSK